MNTGLVGSVTTLRYEYDSLNRLNQSYISPISAASPYSSSSSPSPINSSSSSSTNSSTSVISRSLALLTDDDDRKHFHRPLERQGKLLSLEHGTKPCGDGIGEEHFLKRKSEDLTESSERSSFTASLQQSKRLKFSVTGSRSVDHHLSSRNSPEQSRPASRTDLGESKEVWTFNYSTESYFKSKTSQSSNEVKPAQTFINEPTNGAGLENKFFRDFFFNLRDSVIKDPDTSLQLENGQSLHAHEVMLVNSSPYFRRKLNKLISSQDEEQFKLLDKTNLRNAKLKHCIKISGVKDYASLKICVDFIYSGGTEISLPSNKLKIIRRTAEILELADLVKICNDSEKLLEAKEALIKKKFPPLTSINSSLGHSSLDTSFLHHLSNCQNIRHMMLHQQNQQQQNQEKLLLDPLLTTTYFLNHLSNAAAVAAAQKTPSGFNNDSFQPSEFPRKSASLTSKSAVMMKKANSIEHFPFPSSPVHSEPPRFTNMKTSQEKFLMFKSNSFQEATFDALRSSASRSEPSDRLRLIGHQLFTDSIMVDQVKDHLRKMTTSPFGSTMLASVLENIFTIDTMSKEFIIKDKYIYPSIFTRLDVSDNKPAETAQLDDYFSNYSYMDSTFGQDLNSSSQFNRQSLLIFSVNIDNVFRFNNFVIKCSLDFTNINSLKENIKKSLETSLIYTVNSLNVNQLSVKSDQNKTNSACCINHSLSVDVCQFFYLKKPSNCKTIRMEPIKSSTDCFRAIVEYSRGNPASNELPCVLVTASAYVCLKPA